MTFSRLPAVAGSIACFTCGAGACSDLEMDRQIAVGFGGAKYSKDGREQWSESGMSPYEKIYTEPPTVRFVEGLAKEDPDHDWRIHFLSPMYEAEYQRQGDGIWVLVRQGWGFG